MKTLWGLLCILAMGMGTMVVPVQAASTERLILNVTSDSEDYQGVTTPFSIIHDETGRIEALVIMDHIQWRMVYTKEQLEQPVPIIVKSQAGISKEVLLISAPGFSPTAGGPVVVTLLRQYGIIRRDDYREFSLQLTRGSDGQWVLHRARASDSVDYAFSDMHLEVRRGSTGGEVGIDRVTIGAGGQAVEVIETSDMVRPGGGKHWRLAGPRWAASFRLFAESCRRALLR